MRHILAAAVMAGSIALVTGCASSPPPVSEKVQKYYDEHVASAKATLPAAVKQVKFAAFGDSITEGNSPDFVGGKFGDRSWVSYVASNSLPFAGGWADGGAQTRAMLDHTQPVKADVVVILAGTNDVLNNVPFETTTQNVSGIVRTSGATRVVVSSIPPQDARPEAAVAFNEKMKAFVTGQGWTWVDAAAGLRDGQTYKPSLTVDGIHPTPEGSAIIGAALKPAIQG
ncbi:SGNH/GDSL hydrolase family protein [Arthrobacter sp. C152]